MINKEILMKNESMKRLVGRLIFGWIISGLALVGVGTLFFLIFSGDSGKQDSEEQTKVVSEVILEPESFGNGVYGFDVGFAGGKSFGKMISQFIDEHPELEVVSVSSGNFSIDYYVVITREKLPVAGEEAIAEAPDSLGHPTQWIEEDRIIHFCSLRYYPFNHQPAVL